MAGEVGLELRPQARRRLGQGAGREAAPVVDGAAEGDRREPRAGPLGVLPRPLAGGGEEAVAECRGAGR